jgi:hypothetical protein
MDHGGVTGRTTHSPVGNTIASHDSACAGWKKILAYYMPAVDDASDMAWQSVHPNSGEVVNG